LAARKNITQAPLEGNREEKKSGVFAPRLDFAILFEAAESLEGALVYVSDALVDQFTVLDVKEGGDAVDAVTGGELGGLVDVDLDDGQFRVVGGDFLHNRGKHAARAAPSGEEIDQHFWVGDGFVEVDGFVDVLNHMLDLLSIN